MGKVNATGALGGAASGAALGTAIMPGIGTAVGAIGGGLLGSGILNSDPTAPEMPPIVDPVSGQQLGDAQSQVNQAQGNTASGLAQQQNFVNALNAQNGIGNQSQVYNQLQGIANGRGPNPAQAMLNQATGANVANQAALMASQRGAGANAGMIARQAANQGAAIQQNAVGQGATMQANQSLNAIGAAGNMANQQVGQQANAVGNLNQFSQGAQGLAQSQQNNLLNAQGSYNNALTGGQGNVNNNNQNVAQMQANQTGGLLNGAGAAATALGGMKGTAPTTTSGGFNTSGGTNNVDLGNTGGAAANSINPETIQAASAGGMTMAATGGQIPGPSSFVGRHLANKPQMLAHGGTVDAMVSPGERYLSPKELKKVEQGKKSPMKAGEKIPGKPKVGGATNDYANDTVHKKLQAGGVVLPRSVTQDKNPSAAAAKFVQAILSKQGLKQ